MLGVILSAGSAQGLILGEDGKRYSFTPPSYQGSELPTVGMRVSFEAQGNLAVAIHPIPGTAPAPVPATPAPQQSRAPGTSPVPVSQTPEPAAAASGEIPPRWLPPISWRGFGARRWHWIAAGGGALVVVLLIAGGFVLGFFGSSGPPEGAEIARHTQEGRTYVLVEYGDELAIFADSGAPVSQPETASDILHSYAWRQVIADFDIEGLMDVSQEVQRIDDSVSDLRDLSNGVVSIFDRLDDLETRVPFLGSVSALDVVRETFPGVEEAEDLVRSLDGELNALGDNARTLTGASREISGVSLSSVSGKEMGALFEDATLAALDLESTAGTVLESVLEVRVSVAGLAAALRASSGTPLIGDALGDFARRAERFESELSGLSSHLEGLQGKLEALGQDLQDATDSADETLAADMERWLAMPYDAQWPPIAEGGRAVQAMPPTVAGGRATEATQGVAAEQRATGQTIESQSFTLDWEVSASTVVAGESFTLTVRMYDLGQAGDHGGISVSFPTLTKPGGSSDGYASQSAQVEASDYTGGLSHVAFHQPGAMIYHRDGNRQFPAEFLLVESDDPAWSRSDDRTLLLRITPGRSGEFPILIRGWLCAVEYTECLRNPTSGPDTDQQGYSVEVLRVVVNAEATNAVQPTANAQR